MLKQNGQILSRTKVCPLTNEEMNNSRDKAEQEQFIRLVEEIMTYFDTNIVSSPHVFILDKYGRNREKYMIEPLSGCNRAEEMVVPLLGPDNPDV